MFYQLTPGERKLQLQISELKAEIESLKRIVHKKDDEHTNIMDTLRYTQQSDIRDMQRKLDEMSNDVSYMRDSLNTFRIYVDEQNKVAQEKNKKNAELKNLLKEEYEVIISDDDDLP